MDRIKLLCIIVDREKVTRIEETARASGASFCHIFYGKGTAKNDLLNVLGLGETEKGLVFAAVDENKLQQIYTALKVEYDFDKPGTGISFAIPINSVGGPASLKILQM